MVRVFKLIYMKADYEPWWKFDGWEEQIIFTKVFSTRDECDAALQKQLQDFRQLYPNERCKDEVYWAFWTENEKYYCEGCDDDAQIYHGIMIIQE